ncbi:hypothetical protein BKA63DRAFT_174053 [Paraphoma chrysanthemicola]|nr:hypothetical protein BKA63DRAFT_174053 [Paraphoma chrysanthemicola]
MLSTRLSSRFILTGAVPRACVRSPSRQIRRTLARREYSNGVDGAAQAVNSSSKLPWILSAGALTAGGAYFYLQPTSTSTSSNPTPSKPQPSNPKSSSTSTKDNQDQQKNPPKDASGLKRDWYAEDRPKPVEDRHGDTVKKHSIAAEKNEYKVRHGVFSNKKFDNHIQKREGSPAEEFEEVEDEGGEGGKGEGK